MNFDLWITHRDSTSAGTNNLFSAGLGSSSRQGKAIRSHSSAIVGLPEQKLNHDIVRGSSDSEGIFEGKGTNMRFIGHEKSLQRTSDSENELKNGENEVNKKDMLAQQRFEAVKEKVFEVIKLLSKENLCFLRLVSQVRSKIDPGTPLSSKINIILKILKTKLRKCKRKGRSKDVQDPDSYIIKSEDVESKENSADDEKSFGNNDQASFSPESLLQEMLSEDMAKSNRFEPGGRLLYFISPNPAGLYWLNKKKFPEIKSIWRKKLQKIYEERKPQNWPHEVPENYRLNVGKKPFQVRRPVLSNSVIGIPGSRQNPQLLLAASNQPNVQFIKGHSLQVAGERFARCDLVYSHRIYV